MGHCFHFSELDMPHSRLASERSGGWIKVHIDCCAADEWPAI